MSDRLAALRSVMSATQTDLVALGPSRHMIWLSGVEPHGDERPVMLLTSAHHAGFLMPSVNAESARRQTDLPFYTWRDEDGPTAALADLLAACGADRSGLSVVIDETMRADFALLLLDALPRANRRFTGDTIGALRAVKDDSEYAALKASAVLNDRAMQAGLNALRTGITEREVADAVSEVYAQAGAEQEFALICFGANGAFPHHHTGDTALQEEMPVLIDIGGRHHGYPSDMTRCTWHGETPDKQWLEVRTIVDHAVQAALAAASPGVRARDVDAAARDVIAGAGYGQFFIHRTGHGLGLDVHEPPYITATSQTVLEAGMVFSIEPGVYLPGKFGIRLEEVVILHEDGPEVLPAMPRLLL